MSDDASYLSERLGHLSLHQHNAHRHEYDFPNSILQRWVDAFLSNVHSYFESVAALYIRKRLIRSHIKSLEIQRYFQQEKDGFQL